MYGQRFFPSNGEGPPTYDGLNPLTDEPIKKEGTNVEDHIENSSSPETLTKMTQNKRQSSNVKPTNHTSNNDLENGGNSFMDKQDLWKPLSCLVEAANRTSGPPSPVIKAEQSNDPDNEGTLRKAKLREHSNKSEVQDDKNGDGSSPMPPVVVRTRRRRKQRDLGISTQALIDAARTTRERRTGPIWLSLAPLSTPQQGITQFSACYVRIKWRLSAKASQLAPHYPCTAWQISVYEHRPSQITQALLGVSAQEFVMVLHFYYKAPAP